MLKIQLNNNSDNDSENIGYVVEIRVSAKAADQSLDLFRNACSVAVQDMGDGRNLVTLDPQHNSTVRGMVAPFKELGDPVTEINLPNSSLLS